MPWFSKNKYDRIKKTPWYKTVVKTFMVAVALSGAVWGVFEGVWVITNWHKDEVALEKKLNDLEKIVNLVIENDNKKYEKIAVLEAYIEKKNASFAVGFRVIKIYDESTDVLTFKKMYRDWSGHWNEIHYDAYFSALNGYDYYFYIHRETGDKKYVLGNG